MKKVVEKNLNLGLEKLGRPEKRLNERESD
jgi:hypothetical protein